MDLEFHKDRRSHLYFVAIPRAGTKRNKWICTGERGLRAAKSVVKLMGVDRLVHLHNANAVTAEAVALVTTGQAFTCNDVLRLWLEWFEPRRSKNTVYMYRGIIEDFFRLVGCGDKQIATVTERQIHSFVNGGSVSFTTSHIRLVAMKSIFRFASARAYVMGNPAELAEVDRRAKTLEQLTPKETLPFTDEEWAKVMALPEDDKWRDWAILSYCTGLRMSDCIGLEWASIGPDFIVAMPMKSRGRNSKPIRLPLADPLVGRPELLALLERLKTKEREDPIYIWPTDQIEYAMPEYAASVRMRFYNRLNKLKIVGKKFHGLRVSFARRLEASGKTIEQIAAQMGHANIETTQIYLQKTS